jgi:hypothetical protein
VENECDAPLFSSHTRGTALFSYNQPNGLGLASGVGGVAKSPQVIVPRETTNGVYEATPPTPVVCGIKVCLLATADNWVLRLFLLEDAAPIDKT